VWGLIRIVPILRGTYHGERYSFNYGAVGGASKARGPAFAPLIQTFTWLEPGANARSMKHECKVEGIV
jgi:hypothetical protein